MKKSNMLKRAIKSVKGICVEWEDFDPLTVGSHFIAGKVTHKSPVYRLCANKIFNDYRGFLLTKQRLRWLITITVIVNYANNVTQNEIREIEGVGTISELNSFAIEAIKDAQRYGSIELYEKTTFKIECLGA